MNKCELDFMEVKRHARFALNMSPANAQCFEKRISPMKDAVSGLQTRIEGIQADAKMPVWDKEAAVRQARADASAAVRQCQAAIRATTPAAATKMLALVDRAVDAALAAIVRQG